MRTSKSSAAPGRPAPAASTPSSSNSTRTRRSQLHADRKGGAVVSQPYRPDATVALEERALGDLLSEELRRLDTDEPYRDALEAATGASGLADRSPTREHIWFDPAEDNGHRAKKAAAKAEAKPKDEPKDEPKSKAVGKADAPAPEEAAPKAAKKADADPPAGWKVVEK